MSNNGNNGTPQTLDTAKPVVFIVDDDDGMRRGLEFLLKQAGHQVCALDSAQAFLDTYQPQMRGCVLLDVRMPGMSGLELQEHLAAERVKVPVIILTAYADVPMAVRAMHAGVFDFFEKPFDRHRLIDRVRQAIDKDTRSHYEDEKLESIETCIQRLSPREREVMELVVTGALNKEIADMLGISIKTVENHRARVMQKMEAEYVADLVRMAMMVGIN